MVDGLVQKRKGGRRQEGKANVPRIFPSLRARSFRPSVRPSGSAVPPPHLRSQSSMTPRLARSARGGGSCLFQRRRRPRHEHAQSTCLPVSPSSLPPSLPAFWPSQRSEVFFHFQGERALQIVVHHGADEGIREQGQVGWQSRRHHR